MKEDKQKKQSERSRQPEPAETAAAAEKKQTRKQKKLARRQTQEQQIALEKQLVKEGKILPRTRYTPKGYLGRILAVLLAFLFGMLVVIGGLLGGGYYLAITPSRNLLGMFIDNADVVGMANYSDAVFTESKSNAPGALYSSDRETYFSPVGYALKAYAQNMQAYSAEAVIRQTDKTTALDYALTVSADGKRATLAIVNPSSKSILLNLREDSRIVRKVSVAGTSATAANSADGDEVSYVVTENAAFAAIEPLSITLFVLEIG